MANHTAPRNTPDHPCGVSRGDRQSGFPARRTTAPYTVWHAWAEGHAIGGTLGDLVRDAGYFTKELLGEARAERELNAILRKVLATDRGLGMELEAAIGNAKNAMLDFGVCIGYGLAKTWPGSLEKVAEWPARALEYVGYTEPLPSGDEDGGAA